MRTAGDHGVHGALRYRPVPELVALDLPGGAGFVDTLRAVWDTGDAAAPLDPRLPRAARDVVLAALRPSRVVASDGEHHVMAGGRPVEEGDALVVATSGSSGQPKGVVLTHDALRASARATSDRLGVDPARHAWVACLPLAHVGGLSVVTRALLTGTPLTVLPGFDADAVEALGRSEKATHLSLVPAALRRLDPALFTGILLGGSRPPRRPAGQCRGHLRDDGNRIRSRLRRGPAGRRGGRHRPFRRRRWRRGRAEAGASGGRGRGRRDPPAGPHAPALLPRRFDRARPRARRVEDLVRHRRRRIPQRGRHPVGNRADRGDDHHRGREGLARRGRTCHLSPSRCGRGGRVEATGPRMG